MRILVIQSDYPYPPRTGSAVLAVNNLLCLAKDHVIHLIARGSTTGSDPLRARLQSIDLVAPDRRPKRVFQLLDYVLGICLGMPPSVRLQRSPAMRKAVERASSSASFDVVLVYELSGLQYCPKELWPAIVLNVEDPQSLKLSRSLGLSVWSALERCKLFALALVTRGYERRAISRVAAALVLSTNDARSMREQYRRGSIAAVPYGVEQHLPEQVPAFRDRVQGRIIFSGNMFHPPNIDAIVFFLENVFEKVLTRARSATLWIVGTRPHDSIAKAARRFGSTVIVTGRVDDLSDYVRRSQVSVCPVRLAIGVQTKVLEAMAWGTPVVTTTAGNHGVGATSGVHLWIEDDADIFASRVASLLDGRGWAEMSAAGRQFVGERFSWSRSGAELGIVLTQAALRRSAAAPPPS